MAFPKNLLNHNEELVLDLRPHWLYLVPPSLALLTAVVATLLATLWWSPDGTLGTAVGIVGAVVVVVALVWFLWSYAKWTTTNFVLTSDRIVTRRGVFSKEGVEIPLERVNTVFFRQSLFERMVGAGDLAIESAGERGTETFANIRRPSIVQKEVYVQMESNENRKFDRVRGPGAGSGYRAGSGDPTAVQSSGSIPAQIDQLAELHQRGVLSDSEFTLKKAELLDRM
ncbi:MAG: PH domain-containing protein [Acidimicrobiales bacterium]